MTWCAFDSCTVHKKVPPPHFVPRRSTTLPYRALASRGTRSVNEGAGDDGQAAGSDARSAFGGREGTGRARCIWRR
jgi:hypothetical protein